METSLEVLQQFKRSLTVKLPIIAFRQKVNQTFKKIASNVSIDGFRKGKVPLVVLNKRFGNRVDIDVANEIINETLNAALKDVKITPATSPVLVKFDAKDHTFFSYIVEFEVFPEIILVDFSKLTIEQIKVEVTKEDEDKEINFLKSKFTEYKPVKRKSQQGDSLIIDFEGTINGKDFKEGKAKDFNLVIGSNSMIAGFEKGLINKAIGENITLKLSFPKQYQSSALAGKDVNFEIYIKEICTPYEPKLNTEFAKKFGKSNINSLFEDIKKRMSADANTYVDKQNKEAVFKTLVKAHEFDIPQAVVHNEAQILLKNAKKMLKKQKASVRSNISASAFNEEAKKRVQLSLLVDKIIKNNALSVTKDQIKEKLHNMANAHGENSQQVIAYYNEDPARLASIESLIIEKMVIDIILKQATIVHKNEEFNNIKNIFSQ